MKEATNKKANIRSILSWILIISVNAIVAITIIMMCVMYAVNQNEERYTDRESSFSSALDAMGQTAYLNLHTEQVFCDNWATYINSKNDIINMEAVIKFVGQVNSDSSRAMVHIVDYDTLEGICVKKVNKVEGDKEISVIETQDISYKGLESRVHGVFKESKECKKKGSHLHITLPFNNPVDNEVTLGFCHNIEIQDAAGNKKDYVLVRLLRVSDFYGKWLPPSFNKAKLALVDKNGEFVVHFNSIDGTKSPVGQSNFFDYLADRTDLGASAREELKQNFDSNLSTGSSGAFSGSIKCFNKDGEAGFYSYHRLQSDEEWVLVGYILRDNLNVIRLDTTLVIMVMIGFFILIALDGTYIVIANRRLRTSMRELKDANEAKTRFLSSMSHDIRTPMNAIIGMTTIAAKRIDDKQQVEECLKQITRASNHLLTLINDVLDISKVESGKLSLNPSVFSLAELMSNIISITQPHVKEKEMEFEIHARNIKYEFIFADELRLNQILINLISNAIKYTPEKGKVLIGLEEQPSDKGQNVTRIIFTVTDTGIGISEEFMKTMYETFTRDVDSRINTIQGAGLGLAITKQMVDIMGGTIDVKSKVGEGTKFTVTLDLPIAEKMTDELVLPPMKVLVVDDDELFLESAEDTLKSLGLDTDTVTNGADAVKMVETHHLGGDEYRCVIIDWKMPDMSGVETVRAIREKVGEDVSLIIISAYDWTEIEAEAIKAGANGFITKPLFRSSVYNKLNELLNLNKEEKKSVETEADDLQGLNLLIAEDNDVNWEIIQVMLEFQGITSERANNGRMCVDRINGAKEGEFDAILMDIQMPVMNGKEAAVEIRKSDSEYVRNIPIIAMTADAFVEDIAACKEAGMNGHVAKPLNMQKLIAELRSALKL